MVDKYPGETAPEVGISTMSLLGNNPINEGDANCALKSMEAPKRSAYEHEDETGAECLMDARRYRSASPRLLEMGLQLGNPVESSETASCVRKE
jgi:hypothetical protein